MQVKVRWNACHAAKLILALPSPPCIPGEGIPGAGAAAAASEVAAAAAAADAHACPPASAVGAWGPKLTSALASAGATALNFKVRIQATRALRELQSADFFASPAALEDLWRAAVKAVQVCVSPLQH